MHECVRKSMNNSNAVMERLKPLISQLLESDGLITVEGVDNEVCKLLDVTCGIDYLDVKYGTEIINGIANRVSWIWVGRRPFNTFTIRKSRENNSMTEIHKRIEQIQKKGLYPQRTMHVYVECDTDRLLSIGVARTEDIIDYILKYNPPFKPSEDEHGKAWFFYCSWQDMIAKGYNVVICEPCPGLDQNIPDKQSKSA